MIRFNLSGDREAGLKFEQFPTRAHDALLARISALTDRMEGAALSRVPVATGALSQQVRRFVDDDKDRISGKVKVIAGADKAAHGKAAALEYGAHGRFQVKAHYRLVSTVFGRAVTPTLVFVEAFSRQANITEYRFLRDAIDEIRDLAVTELQAALEEATGAA